MGHKFQKSEVEWLYPTRPLDLLRHWKDIDLLCKTVVPLPHSRFRREWLDRPEEFILTFIDGRLAGAVHVELNNKSADCHIVIKPEWQRSNLAWLMSLDGLKKIFVDNRKAKAHCDIGLDNRLAQRLAGALGFKRVAVYNKRIKYRLTWPDYRDGVGRLNT